MAVEITGRYTGKLGMELTHGPSGAKLKTAAPVDNQGDGSSFSPTDLVAAALGSCMVTTMGILAEREGIDFSSASFHIEKHMAGDPRRIARLPVRIHLPKSLTPEQRAKFERAAHTCPVHRSLIPEVEKDVEFVYE
ncbi:MAG TPA: OsmC family protein [Thermoanaerobaculia bacterium]